MVIKIVKQNLLFAIVLLSFFFISPVYSQFDNYSWLVGIGGSTIDEISALDNHGNVLVAGRFFTTIDLDPGPGEFKLSAVPLPSGSTDNSFIQKLNSQGQLVWAKKLGEGGVFVPKAMTTDANGNIVITGTYEGTVDFDPGNSTFFLTSMANLDVFVMKLDTNGNFLWAEGMGSNAPFESGNEVKIDQSGNIYIGGYFYHTTDFDAGNGTFYLSPFRYQNVFLLKLDGNGVFDWVKLMAGDISRTTKIEIDDELNVYFCSQFSDTAIVENDTLASHGMLDLSIGKLDPDGNLVWLKSIGGTQSEYLTDLLIDHSGNIYLSGRSGDTVDFDPGPGEYLQTLPMFSSFILKLNNSCEFSDLKVFSANELYISNMCMDEKQYLYATGNFSQSLIIDFPDSPDTTIDSKGYSDVLVLKMDTLLNIRNVMSFGGNDTDTGNSIYCPDSNTCYVVGDCSWEMKLPSTNGDYTLPSKSGFFTLKLGESSGNDYRNDFLISSYPNPTEGIIYIEKMYSVETAVLESEVKVFVYDFLGQPVLDVVSQDDKFEINLTNESSGTYFITVQYDGNIYKSKCVKL